MKESTEAPHAMKQTLKLETRPILRLSEIERLLDTHRIITPPLSRRTLNNMCEAGDLETVGSGPTSLGWLVYEDSFWNWVEGLDG